MASGEPGSAVGPLAVPFTCCCGRPEAAGSCAAQATAAEEGEMDAVASSAAMGRTATGSANTGL
eukprot:CAMPEP_0168462392 /NCGR_PEP_ID=MMETSP0228-20121227/54497_1 /TAXON_ID=133427 /ORGANISM="Protoceratium reticulatum, Strain CCCM 535 (=CCMP 1889)" /LENGTH=63 /DNA_ID=CAMNT_0008477777 /DNA_START=75 /DNA_END=263 /DNA_ORIENTATION=-